MPRGTLEIVNLPVVAVDVFVIYCQHYVIELRRIFRHIRINFRVDIAVVIRVKH